ncbi:fibronectin type III domain-containing protein [Amycolatopsis anabasis]|uniref:fibronectin type III domain-containing protein n=1 Tax=Amycolatopsis anabasis TaxID=1840409 RepID=UPI001FE3EBEA|nr:fibronectin type III domain-containing protein [Amycolatopsis anabasis]
MKPTILITALLLTACSPAPAEPAPRLTATLSTPTDIILSWTPPPPGTATQTVEFATEPGGDYTILRFLPPATTTYTHPDLLPETPFYYRTRPVFGPASPPVDRTLPPGDFTETDQRNDHEWASPQRLPAAPANQASVRTGDPGAAPADFRATVMHANGIRFTWTDHATDEDGYLLEIRPTGSPDFSPAAVLDPDVNSTGLITLPTEKSASYRVRAFYYGSPSNTAHQTTGPAPAP